MAVLRASLCAVFMVAAALSKPVSFSEGEDSSKSSESSESNSSEESPTHVGPSQDPLQPASTDTDVPNAVRETNPEDATALLPSAGSGASPATLNTSALPEDPQISTDTDTSPLEPDDPSQTALGTDVSQDTPDPAQDSVNADAVHVLPDAEVSLHSRTTETNTIIGVGGTIQPQATTYQGLPPGATPPFPPHIIKPTAPPFFTTTSLPIPVGTTLTGVPVCFTFQFKTPEPDPPRGDSI